MKLIKPCFEALDTKHSSEFMKLRSPTGNLSSFAYADLIKLRVK